MFRYLATNTHPDHDTLAPFRKRLLQGLEESFVPFLSIAQTMKLLQQGQIERIEAHLREEMQARLARA